MLQARDWSERRAIAWTCSGINYLNGTILMYDGDKQDIPRRLDEPIG